MARLNCAHRFQPFGDAISLGGDGDTQACIAGAIAEAYYKDIPPDFLRQVKKPLSRDLWDKTLERRYGIDRIIREVDPLDRQ